MVSDCLCFTYLGMNVERQADVSIDTEHTHTHTANRSSDRKVSDVTTTAHKSQPMLQQQPKHTAHIWVHITNSDSWNDTNE